MWVYDQKSEIPKFSLDPSPWETWILLSSASESKVSHIFSNLYLRCGLRLFRHEIYFRLPLKLGFVQGVVTDILRCIANEAARRNVGCVFASSLRKC